MQYRLKCPIFYVKEAVSRFPIIGAFLIAVYAAGHYSAHNPLNGILFIHNEGFFGNTVLLSFLIRSPLCPQHLPVRLI